MNDAISLRAYRLWCDEEDEETIARELGVKVKDVAELVSNGRRLVPRKPAVYDPGMGYDTTRERDIDFKD